MANPISLTINDIKMELARKSLLHFSTLVWDGFKVNWHHKLIADSIDALLEGKLGKPNLMVFAPPRHTKSQLVSRNLPAYYLGKYPNSEVICCSYSASLAFRLAKDCLNIMRLPIYQKVFPKTIIGKASVEGIIDKSTIKQDLFTVAGHRGSYRAAGVGGGITGMGFSLGIIDDPFQNAETASSMTNREKVWDWYRTVFATRKSPKAKQILIMTRWHNDDLAGRILNTEPQFWEVIKLPGLSKSNIDLHPKDPRQGLDNVPLWREMYDLDHHLAMKELMGETWYSAMYDQEPIPQGAGLFKVDRIRTFSMSRGMYVIDGNSFLDEQMSHYASIDLAASEEQRSDYTVITFFAVSPQNHYCIKNVARTRISVNNVSDWIVSQLRNYPETTSIAIESTGFQTAIVKDLRRNYNLPNIVEMKPESKSKLVRATSAIIAMENYKILVPSDSPDWISPWKHELSLFTGDEDPHDDMVDSLAYGVRMSQNIIRDKITDVGGDREKEIYRTKLNKYFRRGD